jgi:GNAT superfamily N-acetyltransferase
MIFELLFLQYLLYMDLGSYLFDFKTEHAFAMKSSSLLASNNRVCSNDLINQNDIAIMQSYFGTIPFSWYVNAKNTEQITLLQTHGFTYETSYLAMGIDLAIVEQQKYSDAITIKEISMPNLEKWVDIATQSYRIENTFEYAAFMKWVMLRAKPGQVHLYMAFYNGIPAAVSMTIQHKSILCLHKVGTLPTFRGKGLGYAMSHKPLYDGKLRGCTHAFLLASAQGKPVYEKIGFESYEEYQVYANSFKKNLL